MTTSTFARFKRRALARPEVKAAYDASVEEFGFLDQILKARADAGLTQAEVARRIGTTQSAIARLESADSRHLPSLTTLRKYANALGCRLELRLVREPETAYAVDRQPAARKRATRARS